MNRVKQKRSIKNQTMRKKYVNSRIEIWDAGYINRDIDMPRREEDKNMKIVQIERGSAPSEYIVEIVEE